jgi:hypothetical protein
VSASTAEDGTALRVLVDDYAYAVDNCDSAGVAALFSEDGVLELWPDPSSPTPRTIRRGRSEIVAAIDLMARYYATMHVIANHSSRIDGSAAQGWTRCLAHHVEGEPDARTDLVLAVNYFDAFVRTALGWRFTKREVHVLWTSTTAVDTP